MEVDDGLNGMCMDGETMGKIRGARLEGGEGLTGRVDGRQEYGGDLLSMCG